MTTYLIQILFGATLLLVVASVVNALLYKAAASLRHRVWTCTLLGLLMLPVLSPMLPTMYLAGIPGWETEDIRPARAQDLAQGKRYSAPPWDSEISPHIQPPREGQESHADILLPLQGICCLYRRNTR